MIVDCAYYKDRKRQHEGPIDLERAMECVRSGQGFVWLGMREPTEDELASASRAFDLPKLAVEDTVHAHQRPKLEEYEGHFFIVLKTARYDEAKERVHFGEIHIFLGRGYAITVRHGEASELKPARRAARGPVCRAPRRGPRRRRLGRARPGRRRLRAGHRGNRRRHRGGRGGGVHPARATRASGSTS